MPVETPPTRFDPDIILVFVFGAGFVWAERWWYTMITIIEEQLNITGEVCQRQPREFPRLAFLVKGL